MGTAVVQIFGNVVAHPKVSLENHGKERVSLRVVATERKRDPDTGTWSDGDEFGVNVVCWRALAKGVAASVRRGDPVVVIGKIFNRTFVTEGESKSLTEIRASYIGLDLSKGIATFRRFARVEAEQAESAGLVADSPDKYQLADPVRGLENGSYPGPSGGSGFDDASVGL